MKAYIRKMAEGTGMEDYKKDLMAFLKATSANVTETSAEKRVHLTLLEAEHHKSACVTFSERKHSERKDDGGKSYEGMMLSANVFYERPEDLMIIHDAKFEILPEEFHEKRKPTDVCVKAVLKEKRPSEYGGFDVYVTIRGRDVSYFGVDKGDGDDAKYDRALERLKKAAKKHGFEYVPPPE